MTDEHSNVSDSVLTAVVQAYYPEAIGGGASARLRAQAAQSVASLIAGGLLGVLSFSALADDSIAVRLVAFLAALAWTGAALLYMRAVGEPATIHDQNTHIDSDDDIVQEILGRARTEREIIDRRQHLANLTSALALGASVLAFGLALFIPSTDWQGVYVTPSPADQAAMKMICPSIKWPASGVVDKSSITQEFSEFKIPCGPAPQTFRLRSNSIF